jgi:hypothetical protein
MTGPPQVDIKGFVTLAALLTSCALIQCIKLTGISKRSKTWNEHAAHMDMWRFAVLKVSRHMVGVKLQRVLYIYLLMHDVSVRICQTELVLFYFRKYGLFETDFS